MFNLTTLQPADRQPETCTLAALRWKDTELFAMNDFAMAGQVLEFAENFNRDREKYPALGDAAAEAVHARWQSPTQAVHRIEGNTLVQVFDPAELKGND